MIEKFFEDYEDSKKNMESALRQYIFATQELYSITGINYSDMPKSQGKIKGIDALLVNIETLFNNYIKESSKCTEERNKCMQKIKEIKNITYQLIIELVYLDGIATDKEVVEVLEKYHKLSYAPSYYRKLKSIAQNQFEEILKKG